MPQCKILIVEDEFILYDELCEFFEGHGYKIVKNKDESAVDNFEEALQLLDAHEPDIAILDIRIKGEKDGIDLGAYIEEHYNIPVVYLSSYNTDEHINRIYQTGNERFVIRTQKPFDKSQLLSTFKLALPKAEVRQKRKTIGRFFSVKEVPLLSTLKPKGGLFPLLAKDPVEVKSFFKWDNIVLIESYNKSSNNNVLLHTHLPRKDFVLRGTLDQMENDLPDYFVRFSQGLLINFLKVTGEIRGGISYLIGDEVYKITDTYKSRALEKIARLTGNGQKDIPEM